MTTYYAAEHGDDVNHGLDTEHPITVVRAVEIVTALNGGEIVVMPGVKPVIWPKMEQPQPVMGPLVDASWFRDGTLR